MILEEYGTDRIDHARHAILQYLAQFVNEDQPDGNYFITIKDKHTGQLIEYKLRATITDLSLAEGASDDLQFKHLVGTGLQEYLRAEGEPELGAYLAWNGSDMIFDKNPVRPEFSIEQSNDNVDWYLNVSFRGYDPHTTEMMSKLPEADIIIE